MYTRTASSYCALLLIYMGPTLIFGQLLSCGTLQATAGVIDFQSSDINLRLPLRYPHHRPPLLSRSSSSQEEEERGHGRNASVQSMRRCDCTLGGIRGGGWEGGREAASRGGMKRGDWEEMNGWKAGWTCFTSSFPMNGISQEDCLLCEVMTSIQGNYEHVWLPTAGMWVGHRKEKKNPDISRHPLRPPSLAVAGARAPPTGRLQDYRPVSRSFCRHMQGDGGPVM